LNTNKLKTIKGLFFLLSCLLFSPLTEENRVIAEEEVTYSCTLVDFFFQDNAIIDLPVEVI
jgi:hypothetical protein